MNQETPQSELDCLIPPEIKNDEFYAAIQQIARQESIQTVLEIGSSSGGGSTEAFVSGLQENPNKPTLFCMEVSKPRFTELKEKYKNYSFVKCYNISSVSLEQFPDEDEVIKFYNTEQTALNNYPLDRVLGWLRQDIEYLRNIGVNENGIKKIKRENKIEFFDVVLIDGSEFTGNAEMQEAYGANFILLDDINTFKNYNNHLRLLADPSYELVAQNFYIRNGYSIFKKISHFNFENEKSEQLLVKNIVRPGMTVFDVGANIGDYSILLSNLVGNSGKVYSFEPTSTTFSRLQERISYKKNIYAFQKAVFSEDKEIQFNEFPDDYSVWNSIGRPQMLDPKGRGEYIPIVETEIVEAITLDSFCKQHDIQKIDYLKIDVEGAESDVLLGTIDLLKNKAIQFIQFEVSQNMLKGLNREAKETFKILIENNYECHRIGKNGEIGEEVIDSNSFYENYIAFPSLPIHFFTIVLNGKPFIRYHVEIFKQLPFKWHWHIIEGVADLKHDTSWSLKLGGQITDEIHHNGRSNDGTSEYLDELARLYPDNSTVYRKPEGLFWDGKQEMVNAPLSNIQEECLLWQVDVDELWTVEQLCAGRHMFISNPDKTAAFYWCWYFVGKNLVISTRNCYAQNPQQEWLRTWRYKPGAVWVAHEPPRLVEPLPDGRWRNVAEVNPFVHEETEQLGLIFQHFAYVTPDQLRFKERYYGYTNAVSNWEALQTQTKFPLLLREYFSWVGDDTMVDTTQSCGVVPIAERKLSSNNWRFLSTEEVQLKTVQKPESSSPKIIVDGVFFQLYQSGIARVWKSLLEEWAVNGFTQYIVVIDRAGTAPKISGIRYRLAPAYDYRRTDADREMLQQVCDEEAANLFISSYYTTPLSTPSVFMAYDMIPEVLGGNLDSPMWREKHHGIRHASTYIAISENTARDLVKFFSHISSESITVAPCGVKSTFFPATLEEVNSFRTKYGISKPYFILVGAGSGYKNTILFFRAFAQLYSRNGFDIVCTGSGSLLEAEFRAYTSGSVVHMLHLSDQELRAAYSGSVALVYPSIYEGFGLPILEAIACGCPVITCPNASIPEVAGEAALYVDDDDVEGLVNALCEIQKPGVRQSLISAGLEQAKKFSWSKMARTVSSVLIDTTLQPLNLKDINLIVFPDWSASEESLGLDLERVIRAIATQPNRSHITLLVHISSISQEDANLFLSGVAMNLLMQEDLDVTEGLEISLVGKLGEIQWKALLPRLNARIVLENENQQAIAAVKAETIPVRELDSLLPTG
jgi:FkbM family methyltransferase